MSVATMSTSNPPPSSKTKAASSFWESLFSTELHKRNQGRIVRQATFLVLATAVLIGGYRMYSTTLSDMGKWTIPLFANKQISFYPRLPIVGLVDLIGAWVIFRLVNYKPFADFLIAVETEMVKVSWPTWDYLYRATGVVFAVMVILGGFIYAVDYFWIVFFRAIGFLNISG